MKIIFLMIVNLFLFQTVKAEKVKGQIIYANDTVTVTFKVPVSLSGEINFIKLQGKIKYYDSTGRKVTLKPSEAKEIRFVCWGEKVRMNSVRNNLGLGGIFSLDSHIFLRMELDGKLKLYKYYSTQSSPGMYNASTGMMTGGYSYEVEKYVLQKEEGELVRPIGITFKKDMMKFFEDCPGLAKLIEAKSFRKDDLREIVRYYNYNYNCK